MKNFLQQRLAAWIKRRQGEDALPIVVHRRRLYILPTRGGFAFAALLFFMLIAALNYTNSSALFLTFLLTGFALVVMHRCHRNLLGIGISSVQSLPAFAGETARIDITLDNPTAVERFRLQAGTSDQSSVADVAARRSRALSLPIATIKRGRLRVDRLYLSTTFPFGFFRAWTWAHLPVEILVYPRPHGSLPMPAESGRRFGIRSQLGSGTEEWLGLRPFRDGDSPRQVAWKAYARGAPLLVKEYSASGSDQRLFDFTLLSHLDVEARLEQLARWIVDAEARAERYGLTIGERRIAPDRGPEHRHQCLAALALYGDEADS